MAAASDSVRDVRKEPRSMPSNAIYRSKDELEWNSYDDALNHENRVALIERKLQELGGLEGLIQTIQRIPDRAGGFAAGVLEECSTSDLAIDLEEIVGLGKWAASVLEEAGPCPFPEKLQSWRC